LEVAEGARRDTARIPTSPVCDTRTLDLGPRRVECRGPGVNSQALNSSCYVRWPRLRTTSRSTRYRKTNRLLPAVRFSRIRSFTSSATPAATEAVGVPTDMRSAAMSGTTDAAVRARPRTVAPATHGPALVTEC